MKPVKPYLAVGLGPVIGGASGSSVDRSGAFAGSRSGATFGGFFGAGADILLGRHWSLGVSAGYNLMGSFSQPIGGRSNYSGVDAGVSIGWVWGKGHTP